MKRTIVLLSVLLAGVLVLSSCAGGGGEEKKSSEVLEALETGGQQKTGERTPDTGEKETPAGKDGAAAQETEGTFDLEEPSTGGREETPADGATPAETGAGDDAQGGPRQKGKAAAPADAGAEGESGDNMEYTEVPVQVQPLAERICASALEGDAVALMEMTHPKVLEVKKQMIEHSEQGGWDKYIEKAKEQGSKNPAEKCDITGYREYECSERYVAALERIGVLVEKCGVLKVETVFEGEPRTDQSRVIMSDGEWYFAGN